MDRRNFMTAGLVAAGAAGLTLADQASAQSKEKSSTNAYLKPLDRNNTVLLLVDHQIGLYTGVRDIETSQLKHNVVALAQAVQVLGVPVILTGTMTDGMWGPIIPELTKVVKTPPIVRTVINAWDDPRVKEAVKATGRTQVVISGVSLEVCATFPALGAKRDGFDSRVVLDASGTFSATKRQVGISRLEGAGIPLYDYATVAVEMLKDNADPKAHDVYHALDMDFANLVWHLSNKK